jgi:Spy/CpxP family protein refolding chaperone
MQGEEQTMNGMKTARLALVVAGVLMAGVLAIAQGPGGQGAKPGVNEHKPPIEQAFGFANGQFWNNPNMIQDLSLTDDQRKAMDGILQDHKMKLIDLHANLDRAEVILGPMLKADAPDQKAIEAQIDKIVAARAELERENARFLLDIRLQLKPDQWRQLQTLREQKAQRDRMREQGNGAWGHDGQRPGAGGPDGQFHGQGNQFRGPGGQFHKQPQSSQPPADTPPPTPAPAPAPAPAPGDTQ